MGLTQPLILNLSSSISIDMDLFLQNGFHDAKIKEKVGENSPERGSHDDTFTYSLLIKPLINAVVNTKVLSQYINAALSRGTDQYRYLNLQFSGPSKNRGSKPQMSSFAYAELLLHLEIRKCVKSQISDIDQRQKKSA